MKPISTVAAATLMMLVVVSSAAAAGPRSDVHNAFIAEVRDAVSELGYRDWPVAEERIAIGVGPWLGQKTFLSDKAQDGKWPTGTRIVSEHWAGDALVATSVFLKQRDGYSERNRDWYWIQFLADGTVVAASPDKEEHRKPGFVTQLVDGRLWIFTLTGADVAEFVHSGELARSVTRPGAGPGGMTVRSGDSDTIEAYLASKPGFVAWPQDGRLWVFRADDPELGAFLAGEEPVQVVVRPGAGPGGVTLKATESETITEYLVAKPGFETFFVEGRLWVFKSGAEELAEFKQSGELAQQVVRPGAGPDNVTLKGPDAETLDAYLN